MKEDRRIRMDKRKRIFTFIMVFTLMLGLLVPGGKEVQAAAAPVISWNYTVDGDYVTLRFTGSNFTNIMQLGLEITYEDSFLSLADYDDTTLTGQVDGVHPTLDDSESGQITFSVFTNDGALSFAQSEILKLTFRSQFAGKKALLFGLKVTECKDNTGTEVSTQYNNSCMIYDVGKDEEQSYDCGLVSTTTVPVGDDVDVELYFYQNSGISSGSFDIIYNPEQLKYIGCTSDIAGIRIEDTAADASRVRVSFVADEVVTEVGELFHIHFTPVKGNCTTNVKMENLLLLDDALKEVEMTSNNSVSLQVMEDGAVNCFTLTAPSQVFTGKLFEVNLGISNNEGFHTLDGRLTYDPELFEFVDGAFSPDISGGFGCTINQISDGTVQVQMISSDCLTNNGTIATLHFRAKGASSAFSYMNFEIQENGLEQLIDNNEDRSLTSVPGSCAVQVLEPCTTHIWDSGVVTKKATYTAAGTMTYTCTRCGEVTTKPIAMLTLAKAELTSIENTSSGISLKWKQVSGAAGYQVYRKSGSGSYKKIATINKPTLVSYQDSTVKSGTTYTYQIRAYNSSQTGTAKNSCKQKYLSAVSVSSVENATSGVQLKWKKVTGASGYTVYRKMASGAYKKLTTIKTNKASYTDKTAVNGTKYTYKVVAYSGAYVGVSGNTKTLIRLTTPSISSVTSKTAGTLTVKCRKNAKAAGYQIQISTTSDFKKIAKSAKVSSQKAVSKKFSKLSKGTKYYVRVRTYKKSGSVTYYSVWSSVKNKKTAK